MRAHFFWSDESPGAQDMALATGLADVTALRRLADLHGNAPAVCDNAAERTLWLAVVPFRK